MAAGTVTAPASGNVFGTILVGGVNYPLTVLAKADGTPYDGLTIALDAPTLAALKTVSLGLGSAAIGTVGVTGSVAVTGTFFPATQPVSLATQPLPTGAATDASVAAITAKLGTTLTVSIAGTQPTADSAVLTAIQQLHTDNIQPITALPPADASDKALVAANTAAVAAITAKLPAAPALDATVAALGTSLATLHADNGTLATQATLAAVLAAALLPPLSNPNDLVGARISISTAAVTPLAPAVVGQTTRIHKLRFKSMVAQNVDVMDGAAILERIPCLAGDGISLEFHERPHYRSSVNSAISLQTSASGVVEGRVAYVTSA